MAEYLTQDQFLISLSVFPDYYFSTFSGVEYTAEFREVDDGLKKFYLRTKARLQPMQLTRIGDVNANLELDGWAKSYCRDAGSVILTIIPLKPCEVTEPYDRTVSIKGVVPTRWKYFQSDKASTERSMFELDLIAQEESAA